MSETTYYTVAVNQHLVCATPRRYVSEFIFRVCDDLRGYFPAFDEPYARRRRVPEPLIEHGSIVLRDDCPYINYRLPSRFDPVMFTEPEIKMEPMPIYQVEVSRNLTGAFEALARAIRENLKVSI